MVAFVRIGANPRLHQHPLTPAEVIWRVQSWLLQPCVRIALPTDLHWAAFQRVLRAGNATGNLISNAHLAALAIEHNCALYSTDSDFARFRGLEWKNPIAAENGTV